MPVAGHQRRPAQQRAQVGRAVQLARVGPQRLHPLVVGPVGAEQRLDRQRAGDVGGLHQQLRVMHREREHRLHRLGAVDQRQALLGRELQRLDPVLGQHLRGRAALRPVARPAQPSLADQRLGQVRELGEVAGGADRALAGNDREQTEVQELEQPLRQVAPDAGVPGGQRSGPQQEHRAHGGVVERRRPAPAACEMTIAPCSRRQVLLPHPGVGQRAEPGVHPVDRVVARDGGGHHLAAGLHPGGHVRPQLGAGIPARHVNHILAR